MNPRKTQSEPLWQVVPAEVRDQRRLQKLVRSDPHVHRHLGWIPPLEWLGRHPFLTLQEHGSLRAALACPPDQDGRAWLRLTAVGESLSRAAAWNELWPEAVDRLQVDGSASSVQVLVIQRWLEELLVDSGFEQIGTVVVLDWDAAEGGKVPPGLPLVEIRKVDEEMLDPVHRLDRVCFGFTWGNTRRQIARALRESALSTAAVVAGEVVGFQISTAGTLGGHLARLAVDPEHRGQGIGKALVADVLDRFQEHGLIRVTVNTQRDNTASLEIYRQFGFVRQDPTYPVYRFPLEGGGA
mgnify:CR=1 FL=1